MSNRVMKAGAKFFGPSLDLSLTAIRAVNPWYRRDVGLLEGGQCAVRSGQWWAVGSGRLGPDLCPLPSALVCPPRSALCPLLSRRAERAATFRRLTPVRLSSRAGALHLAHLASRLGPRLGQDSGGLRLNPGHLDQHRLHVGRRLRREAGHDLAALRVQALHGLEVALQRQLVLELGERQQACVLIGQTSAPGQIWAQDSRMSRISPWTCSIFSGLFSMRDSPSVRREY